MFVLQHPGVVETNAVLSRAYAGLGFNGFVLITLGTLVAPQPKGILDPATGKQHWKSEALTGKIFSPVGAVPGVAFCGTDQGRLLAFAPATGATLWSMDAPAKTACGPSIVDGRVLWGYGFIFSGAPGLGGILALEVPK